VVTANSIYNVEYALKPNIRKEPLIMQLVVPHIRHENSSNPKRENMRGNLNQFTGIRDLQIRDILKRSTMI